MHKSLKNKLPRIYVYYELADGEHYAVLLRGLRCHSSIHIKENIFIKNIPAFDIVWTNRHNLNQLLKNDRT